jgi:uncharacterized protein (TIGR03790 family)
MRVFTSECHRLVRVLLVAMVMGLAGIGSTAHAQAGSDALIQRPMQAQQLGLIINRLDPYSVAVGRYYARVRKIPKANIVQLDVPTKATLTREEFEAFAMSVRQAMPSHVQALAVAWTEPYAVECNSLSTALGWRFQPEVCKHSCSHSATSPYFDSSSPAPYDAMGIRPTMLLASRSVEEAKQVIDRGRRSSVGAVGGSRATPQAVLVSTQDMARNVRARLYPKTPEFMGVRVNLVNQPTLHGELESVVLFQIGAKHVEGIRAIAFIPGALADHLTSFGGQLLSPSGQMSVLDWLEAGAAASHGSVSEPCNHLEKFPHPQVLLKHYASGASAVEAYWRSVAWPAQSVFVGDPLAAPFRRRTP